MYPCYLGRRGLLGCPAVVMAVIASVLAGCHHGQTRTSHLPPAERLVRLGLCEDYPEESRTLSAAKTDLARAKASGASVLRIAFGWDAMEPERGTYDWTFWDEFVREAVDEHGLTLIPYVCYTPRWAASDPGENFWRSPPRDPADFGRLMARLVDRYRERIHSWELWNEPDNPAYWSGSVAQYATLVRAGSAAVRQTDSRDRVVLGGIATELDFLEQVLREEGVAKAIDVVNLHSYFETWHPEPLERLTDYLEDAAELVRRYGESEPLWLAETGYSSVGERRQVSDVYRATYRGEHTEAAQAAALAKTFLLALAVPQVELIAWYRINDLVPAQEVIGDDNNRHLGVRRVDGTAKPAEGAFTQLARLFGGEPFRPVELTVEATGVAREDVVARAFALQNGQTVVAVWLARPGSAKEETLPWREDARRGTVAVRLPPREAGTTLRGLSLGSQAERAGTIRQGPQGLLLNVDVTGGEGWLGVVTP